MRQLGLFCAAVAAATVAVTLLAGAQTSSPPPDYSRLAHAITHSFFSDEGAKAGNDWCYQIEADPSETVWGFLEGNGWTYPQVIDYAVRIRLVFPALTVVNNVVTPVYDAANHRVMDTASLFMGFDLMANPSYDLMNASARKQRQIQQNTPTAISPAGTVTIPSTSPSNCPKFSSMLGSIFWRYPAINGWAPLGDPNCDDLANQCQSFQLPDSSGKMNPYVSRQTSYNTLSNLSTWTFNGVTHKIPRAIKFLFPFGPNGTAAYFMIGFGGSGGAG